MSKILKNYKRQKCAEILVALEKIEKRMDTFNKLSNEVRTKR